MNKCIWIFLITLVVISSCKKEETQAEIDDRLIQEYFSTNNITDAQLIPGGVYYLVDSLGDGSGIYPNFESTVRVHYRGYFLDETDFDPGNFDDTPDNFMLSGTIPGWRVGMPFFEKGAVGRLFVPSAYGYGTRGNFGVPPNTVLIFDVKLINVFN